jgi:ATP-binding cassette subfamily C protein LapB
VTQLLTRINQTLHSYKLLDTFMGQAREHAHGRSYMARDTFKGAIEFRNVTFTYPGAARPALQDVSFQIAAGERVAILGKVGSGKTTVAKLILGLYEPESGAVLIDGVDVRQLDPADLRRALGVVLQDVWLMGGTVRQNIALSIAYNVVMVPVAVAGYVTPWLAALAMSSSSLLVIGNSFRLRWRA